MKFGLVLPIIAIAAATSPANATIMSVDYTVNVLTDVVGSATVADVSVADPDFSGNDPLGLTYTFDFTGDTLTLTVDLNGFGSIGASVDWDFSNISFTNGPTEVITDVVQVGGNGGAAAIADGDDFIIIDTPDEMPDDVYTYVFDITTNFSSPTPVPEPSSCALFLVGGLAAWRIRRKRAA